MSNPKLNCPGCGAAVKKAGTGTIAGLVMFDCCATSHDGGKTISYETITCVRNQLSTERARLAQVKAWTTKVHPLPAERTLEAVGQCIELVIKNLEALDRIPSDTPEVLAVVECRICPNCKVWGIDDFVHLDGCNRVGVEGTITVTARTEGGESEWDLGATAQGRSSVK